MRRLEKGYAVSFITTDWLSQSDLIAFVDEDESSPTEDRIG
jgi:hypothetical protein